MEILQYQPNLRIVVSQQTDCVTLKKLYLLESRLVILGMIKISSKDNNLPYRNLSLDVLGALSPIKTKTRQDEEEVVEETANLEREDDFTSPGRRNRRQNFIPKETTFRNITSILDGFDYQRSAQRHY